MKQNSNKIVIVVFCALIAIFLVIMVTTILPHSGGGGGAAPATKVSTTNNTSTNKENGGGTTNTTSSPSTTGNNSTSASPASPTTSGNSSTSASPTTTQPQTTTSGNVTVRPVEAHATRTVAEVYSDLNARGFAGSILSADFDMDGEYVYAQHLDVSSNEKYPECTTIYSSPNGLSWAIIAVDGKYYAKPLSTGSTMLGSNIIVTELNEIVQYDSTKNALVECTIKNPYDVVPFAVESVDKQTLDSIGYRTLAAL